MLAAELPKTAVLLEMGDTAHVADWVARGDTELGFIEGPGHQDDCAQRSCSRTSW
jgi:hypothetical protein